MGLVAFLLGLRSSDGLNDQALIGSLFENLVVADIIKKNHHSYQLQDYWFWRDANGHEVDLLTNRAGGFDIFEIKATQTILPKLFLGMDYFASITAGKTKTKTLIYGGEENQDRTKYAVRTWDAL